MVLAPSANPLALPKPTAAKINIGKVSETGRTRNAIAEKTAADPAAHQRPSLSEMMPVGAIIKKVATPAIVKISPVIEAE